ncbi:uncharacterized protein LOC135223997 [Macrobrachium nipponense]|uniref:uncharacterized protein LOC135223997 n=1 Tax=Macrobrachium nipponense TaxID=159736 RepID=UPI0030C82471
MRIREPKQCGWQRQTARLRGKRNSVRQKKKEPPVKKQRRRKRGWRMGRGSIRNKRDTDPKSANPGQRKDVDVRFERQQKRKWNDLRKKRQKRTGTPVDRRARPTTRAGREGEAHHTSGTAGGARQSVPGWAAEARHVSWDGRPRAPPRPGTGGRGPPRVLGRASKARHMYRDRRAEPATCPETGQRAGHVSRDGQAWPTTCPRTGGRGPPSVPGRAGMARHVSRDI